jgi:S-adenosylmethionine synthetase
MNINTFETNTVSEEAIERAINRTFSFKPADIIEQLDLLRPIYRKTTNYGHFGKIDDPDITWESTKISNELRRAAH